MKRRLITNSIILSLFLLILNLNSCTKEGDENNFDANIQTAMDYVLCEISALDAFNIVFTSGIDSILFADGTAMIDNANVTLNTSGDTTITIDFGSIPVHSFGKMRGGMITAALTTLNLLQTGAMATITFDNYAVEGNHLDAQSVILENVTAGGNPTFNLNFNQAKLYKDGGTDQNDTLRFNSSKMIVMTQGSGTPNNHEDDIFSVSGTANGTSSKGSNYTAETSSDLVLDFSCQWLFTQGVLNCTTPEYIDPAVIDFGDGSCNDAISVTLHDNEGSVYNIPAILP